MDLLNSGYYIYYLVLQKTRKKRKEKIVFCDLLMFCELFCNAIIKYLLLIINTNHKKTLFFETIENN